MTEDIKKVKALIDDLAQRVLKQEQKMLSLERELAEKTCTHSGQEVDIHQAVDSYKEPILRRASNNSLLSTINKKKRPHQLVLGVGLFGIGLLIGYVLVHYYL